MPSECALWEGARQSGGYGHFRCNKRNIYAHRFAYELLVGAIPDGMVVDHLCRTRACVNPQHMEIVTQRVNILRGTGWSARNAAKTHCKRGHPLEGANLYEWHGHRLCRTCRKGASS